MTTPVDFVHAPVLGRRLTGSLPLVFLALCFVFVAAVPVWHLWVAPKLLRMPADFTYRAEVVSLDNFYDEPRKRFSGEMRSRTLFSYDVVSKNGDILELKNVFDVRKLTGEKIFAVERLYGVNATDGRHVSGYGDRDRTGYLFAPRDAPKGGFTYWHVNYDSPARLEFRNEEQILGLTVYRYETDYHADQTENLGHLPGVPETRRVKLDVNIQLWVEPVSGSLVKYEDRANAYYASSATNRRLHPWNRFRNRFTEASVAKQVDNARDAKRKVALHERWIPILFGLVAFAMLGGHLLTLRRMRRS